ncbi:uncharacterized protein LOC135166809 isoform X2 [Diachasmimorpha longicaudata]|uniref:uncharacterized protein LOC135166809 isoform X2 n=1 Tax=Diachasmimorpha longicaudata TaxID=58733 RepID=UPI0030B8CF3F
MEKKFQQCLRRNIIGTLHTRSHHLAVGIVDSTSRERGDDIESVSRCRAVRLQLRRLADGEWRLSFSPTSLSHSGCTHYWGDAVGPKHCLTCSFTWLSGAFFSSFGSSSDYKRTIPPIPDHLHGIDIFLLGKSIYNYS